MEQKDSWITDYKKWLAFNNELADQQEVLNLYKAIQTLSTSGNYSCENFLEHGKNFYLIKHPSFNALCIDAHEKESLLAYLTKHYLRSGHSAPTTEKRMGLDNIMLERGENSQGVATDFSNSHFFLNYNIAFHAIGYALVTIVVMQIFLVPYLNGATLPWFIKVLSLFVIALISYAGVSVYKKHFLESNIEYITVAKITVGIFGLAFSALAFEVMLFQIFSGSETESNLGVAVAGAGIFISGLIGGWIFSLPLYFLTARKRDKAASKSSEE
jgi:hypothetical protein